MTAQRKKAENLIYDFFNILDTTGTNTAYYKSLFSKMSDAEFTKFCKRDLPFRFHNKPWVTEPPMEQVKNVLDFLGVPLTERIAQPYLYKDNITSKPVWSKPAIVVYIHMKKMKQFIVKKNNVSADINQRDLKTGLLIAHDKGGKTSDRELEGLIAFNMNHTLKELTTFRADYMNAKTQAYATISTEGRLSEKDIDIEKEDSLAKNMLNYYMLSAGLYTNILNKDYMLPSTISGKERKVTREVES